MIHTDSEPDDTASTREMPPVQAADNTAGTVALCTGVAACVLAFMPLVGFLAIPLLAVGITLGAISLGKARRGTATNRLSAIVGIVLSLAALVICVLWGLYIAHTISTLPEMVPDMPDMPTIEAPSVLPENTPVTPVVEATQPITDTVTKLLEGLLGGQ